MSAWLHSWFIFVIACQIKETKIEKRQKKNLATKQEHVYKCIITYEIWLLSNIKAVLVNQFELLPLRSSIYANLGYKEINTNKIRDILSNLI